MRSLASLSQMERKKPVRRREKFKLIKRLTREANEETGNVEHVGGESGLVVVHRVLLA
jgi:hypothetical protein